MCCTSKCTKAGTCFAFMIPHLTFFRLRGCRDEPLTPDWPRQGAKMHGLEADHSSNQYTAPPLAALHSRSSGATSEWSGRFPQLILFAGYRGIRCNSCCLYHDVRCDTHLLFLHFQRTSLPFQVSGVVSSCQRLFLMLASPGLVPMLPLWF